MTYCAFDLREASCGAVGPGTGDDSTSMTEVIHRMRHIGILPSEHDDSDEDCSSDESSDESAFASDNEEPQPIEISINQKQALAIFKALIASSPRPPSEGDETGAGRSKP